MKIKANRRVYCGASAAGTVKQMIVPSSRNHEANFHKILPLARDKLIKDGLFVQIGVDEYNKPIYKITKKGLAKLKELENGH